ncbi:hypothetical protein ACVRXQ_04800 [Streptococcus panodentis]|uniref:Uncharacterized protein n=1 Tax=Streptococcus panodentis TaxID=1581472 RepID=A0ABS5AWR1_9STRE|nr:hypothetical protein [Streptococcus panodentis]MBP2620940.1 hypothetical protein [Streptococcus panodentis]
MANLSKIELTANNNFIELMKAQERKMINALIQLQKSELEEQSNLLAAWLAEQKAQMSDFAAVTLKGSLEGGFSGEAATAAADYLTSIPQANLQNPIK